MKDAEGLGEGYRSLLPYLDEAMDFIIKETRGGTAFLLQRMGRIRLICEAIKRRDPKPPFKE